jgi:cation transport regulator ChaC
MRALDGRETERLDEAGRLVAYFGYGSLVNRATHRTEIVDAVPARLSGWRRHWRARPDMPGFPAALLTIREEAGASCDGLVVVDRAENLAAVDEREARYRRVALTEGALEVARPLPRGCPVYVYVAEADVPLHPEPPAILQSYLDAVMQGFLAEHGEAGLRRFVAETGDFDIPILRDRLSPRYPRAVVLADAEPGLFERVIAGIEGRFLDL